MLIIKWSGLQFVLHSSVKVGLVKMRCALIMLNPLYRFCIGSVTKLSSSKKTQLETHVCKGGQCMG